MRTRSALRAPQTNEALRTAYVPPEFALLCPPKLLRRLFDLHACSDLLPRGSDARALARALFGIRVPSKLAHDLVEFTRLASDVGRDALIEAALDVALPSADWEETSAPALALLVLSDRSTYARVIARAELRLARLLPLRPTYDVRLPSPLPCPDEKRVAATLRAMPQRTGADVWVHIDEASGKMHVAVLFSMPIDAAGGTGENAGETPRALRADTFVYDPKRGRLSVTPYRSRHLRACVAAFGDALAGDASAFLDRPSVTLKPLQTLGRSGLEGAKRAARVLRQRVIACQIDAGDGARLEARSKNALDTLGSRLRRGGYATKATLRFNLEGAAWPVDAVLELPFRVSIGGVGALEEDIDCVRDALDGLGIFSPGSLADDVVTLLPGLHAEWRFDDLLGGEAVARLKGRKILTAVSGESTRRPATGSLGRVARSAISFEIPVETVKGEKVYYCIPEDSAIPASTLRESEMAMCRWHVGRVVSAWQKELGLAASGRGALPKGVHLVGERRAGGGMLVLLLVLRAYADAGERLALGKAITKAAKFGKPVVLVPVGRRLEQGFLEIELDLHEQFGCASFLPKLRAMLAEHEIEEDVPIEWRARGEARIVVDSARKKIVVDGVVIEKASETAYHMVHTLAKRGAWQDDRSGGETVATDEMDRLLSGARGTDGTTRQAAFRLARRVNEAFEAVGRVAPAEGKIVVRAKGGWQLFARAEVV